MDISGDEVPYSAISPRFAIKSDRIGLVDSNRAPRKRLGHDVLARFAAGRAIERRCIGGI